MSKNEEVMLPWVEVQKLGLAYIAQLQLWREWADAILNEPKLADVMTDVIDSALELSPMTVSA